MAACLKQEDENLVVLEQHSIIHNHGHRPGHFVVQSEGQKLSYIALAAALTASSRGDADGRVLMQQLHYNITMLVRERVGRVGWRTGGGWQGGGG